MNHYLTAIKSHYADFSCCATRTQFWMFTLVHLALIVLANVIMGVLTSPGQEATAGAAIISIVVLIYVLSTLIPAISISVRRLHDAGWYLVGFVPLLGLITLVFYFLPTKEVDNKYK